MIVNGVEIEFVNAPLVVQCRFNTGFVMGEDTWRIGFFGTLAAQPKRGISRHRFRHADFWYIENPRQTLEAALEMAAAMAKQERLDKMEIFEVTREVVRICREK